MSTVLRFFILFGVLSAVLCYNIRDDAAWFKDRDRITDRFLVGMIKGRNALCNATRNGVQVEGVCMSTRECLNSGGVKGSACSLLGTCCIIEKTCSNVTNAKLSYFVPPKVFQSDCPLTVKPINRDVCQIRLDFQKFTIAKPSQPDEYYGSNKSYQCLHDSFTVTSVGSNIGFVHLCGENTKQHIYVPVSNNNNVVLRFQLYPNRNSSDFFWTMPEWRIKIHQLECSRSYSTDINNIHSSLTTMHHSHSHRRPSYNSDYELIAPSGCLQYYPARTGIYESFNFNQGQGPYIGMTSYAICFRKTPDVCGIRHTAQFFVMSYNFEDELICHPNRPADEVTSQDSLQIPGGMFNNVRTDYFCDEQLKNNTPVTSYVPGPLYVVVRTDAFQPYDRLELGFRIQYELLNSGCNLQQ